MALPEKSEREKLIEEFLMWLNAMEDDEVLRRDLSSPEFLAEVTDQNLRILIASKKRVYRATKELYDILKNRKPDTSS